MTLISLVLAAAIAAQASPETLDPATCADPAKRHAFLEAYKDPESIPLLAKIEQGARDNEKRFSAKLDRLAERAHWSAQRKGEMGMAVLQDPEFEKLMDQNMAALERMTAKLDALKAETDEAKQCTIVAGMLTDLVGISAAADQQWALMDARLEAEAKKAGVTLK